MEPELIEPGRGAIDEDKEMLYLLGGLALMTFGAGLILSNSAVRRYLSQGGARDMVRALLPNLEKYFNSPPV